MSSALPLIVFGQVYFLGSGTNIPYVTPNLTLTPTIDQHPSQPGQIRGFPRDYTYTPGIGAYKVHNKAETWNTARKVCASEGGHLAIINSVAESKHIAQLAREAERQTGSSFPECFNVGAHNLFNLNEWVTIHSEPLEVTGFNDWDDGQPDRGDAACAGINYANGKLDDSSCLTPLGFICELPNIFQ